MAKKIVLNLNRPWVLSRRDDEVLPIGAVINYLNTNFKEVVTVLSSSMSFIEMTLEPEDVETVKNGLKEFLVKQYSLENSDVFDITVEDYVAGTGEGDKKQSDFAAFFEKLCKKKSSSFEICDGTLEFEEAKTDDSSSEEDSDDIKEEKVEPKVEKKVKPDNGEKLNKAIQVAQNFMGGTEYSKLVDEIVKVAPLIVKHNTLDTFTHQTYLFSINDGYGLEDYLDNLMSILSLTGIADDREKHDVTVEKLDPPKNGDLTDALKSATSMFSFGLSKKVRLLCYDISEWMNHLKTKAFKEFLLQIEGNLDKAIVVFRVPFVDKEVLKQTKEALSDVVYVRSVSFPPYTSEEIRTYADSYMQKMGFYMEYDAWEYFDKRILEEKSDGNFYGTDTIKKVVRELLYKTQLIDAENGEDTNLVTRDKAIKICADPSDVGMSGYEMLENMVGGARIKEKIDEIISQIELSRRSPELGSPSLHMRFVGNPGTGKTTVARIVGKILKERGVLRIGNFYECSGRDLCGRYIGETAPKTASMCRDAYGSVLFIDEAYSLYRGDENSRDFGREALDTLIAEMENHRKDFVVIMAGYPDDMIEWHGHNDFYKAVANATCAWLYGASSVNCSLLGIGERTGNADSHGRRYCHRNRQKRRGLAGEAVRRA